MGSGNLDRSRSDQRNAPRSTEDNSERRGREEATRGAYRGNGRSVHSDRPSDRQRGSPPRDGASSVSGRPRPEATSSRGASGQKYSNMTAKDIRYDKGRH